MVTNHSGNDTSKPIEPLHRNKHKMLRLLHEKKTDSECVQNSVFVCVVGGWGGGGGNFCVCMCEYMCITLNVCVCCVCVCACVNEHVHAYLWYASVCLCISECTCERKRNDAHTEKEGESVCVCMFMYVYLLHTALADFGKYLAFLFEVWMFACVLLYNVRVSNIHQRIWIMCKGYTQSKNYFLKSSIELFDQCKEIVTIFREQKKCRCRCGGEG